MGRSRDRLFGSIRGRIYHFNDESPVWPQNGQADGNQGPRYGSRVVPDAVYESTMAGASGKIKGMQLRLIPFYPLML